MYKLTSQASRISLILSVIAAMEQPKARNVIKVNDLKTFVDAEMDKRPYLKPVMVEHRSFPSTSEAVRWLAKNRRDLWVNSKAAQRMDAHGVMNNLRTMVRNWCNADNVDGYYWI